MTLYLWKGKLLIRTINGVTGLANSAACCCEDCECDSLPDKLHLQFDLWMADDYYPDFHWEQKVIDIDKGSGSAPCDSPDRWNGSFYGDDWDNYSGYPAPKRQISYCVSLSCYKKANSLNFIASAYFQNYTGPGPNDWYWQEVPQGGVTAACQVSCEDGISSHTCVSKDWSARMKGVVLYW